MSREPQSDPVRHVPVLPAEVLEILEPGPGRRILDVTVGLGGHAAALLEAGATVVGLDRDPAALARAADRLRPFGDRAILLAGDLGDAVAVTGVHGPFDGLLADLGVSSLQLDDPTRGFSFAADGPLDMRMDPSSPLTAADLLNERSADELAGILRTYGEERLARPIARRIVNARRDEPLGRTSELAGLVSAAYRKAGVRTRTDPATRTFQALRIAVNHELDSLDRLLASVGDLVVPGGVACIVSFHSLEDRRVKKAFRELARGCVCPPDLPVCACGRSPRARDLTRRVVRPSPEEIERNPRARSARLRAIRWIGEEPA